MSEFNINIAAGERKRLLTGGKYCENDILVSASGGADPVIQPLSVTANGTYTAPEGVDGYSPVTVNVPSSGGGGDTSIEDGIIKRSIAGKYTNDRVTVIGTYAFRECTNLTEVNFPAVENIGSYSFYNCTGLTKVDFPVATTIESYAFNDCSKLQNASFLATKNLNTYAFRNCTLLVSAYFPLVTSIKTASFYNCASLTKVDFPVATTIGSDAFYRCTNLTEVNFPAVTTISGTVFNGCTNLTEVDLPVATTIGGSAFNSCTMLSRLILRSSVLVNLLHTNAFSGTAILSGAGYIYVPSALVDSYKAATNWSTYADQFRALEDYTVDGTTTGALDPDMI